jgi:hypothetical protein
MAPQASLVVWLGILLIAVVMAALFVVAGGVAARRLGEPSGPVVARAAMGVVAWLGFSAALALSGVLSRWDVRPPPMAVIFLGTISLGIGIGVSNFGRRLSRGLPLVALVLAQGFRFPLEIVMHQAALEGVMPVQMSYSGYNFDIVTGISAIAIAALLARGKAPRWLLFAWSAYGLSCLVVIAVVALAAMPLIHAFGTAPEQLNTWVAYFPFVWLPASLVTLAITGHIVVLRKLLAEAPRPRVSSSALKGA